VVTRQFDFADFDSLEIGDSFKFDVAASDTFSVEVVANENLFEGIEVQKTGNTLKIGMDWPGVLSFGSRTSEVKITMPELASLKISGATTGTVEGFKSSRSLDTDISGSSTVEIEAEIGDFTSQISGASRLSATVKSSATDIELSGSSNVELELETGDFRYRSSGASRGTGTVKASATDISLSSSSRIGFTGSGGNLVLSGSGASTALLEGYTVQDTDVRLSGSSRADVDISGKLDVSLSGASELRYGGSPTLGKRMEISGGSRFERR
jgi:hypothetical protein